MKDESLDLLCMKRHINSNEQFIKNIAVHQKHSSALVRSSHYDDNKCKLKYFNIQSI